MLTIIRLVAAKKKKSSLPQVTSPNSSSPPPPAEKFSAWLSPLITLVDLVLFAYTMYVNDCPAKNTSIQPCYGSSLHRFAFEPLSVNKYMGPSISTLAKLGALDPQKVVDGEWWRLISCMWIHSGLRPLFVSILRILVIGIPLEWEFGAAKFGTLYLLSGVGASLVSCLYNQELSSGASGAIFGLVGGLLSEIITNWTIYENKCAAFQPLIIAVVINISTVFISPSDNYAHIGGFIFGFLLGFVFLTRPQPGWTNRKHILPGHEFTDAKPKFNAYQSILRFAALLLLIIGYVGCMIKVFHDAGHNIATEKTVFAVMNLGS